jgi:hypothetical protein
MGLTGIIIFTAFIVTIVNLLATKQLTEILSETIFDKPIFYRICMIPPIGIITYTICIMLFILVFLLTMIKDIWR